MADYLVREIQESDAAQLIELIPRIDEETQFMLRDKGEFKMSLESEIEYIKNTLRSDCNINFVVLDGSLIVGLLGFQGIPYKRYRHSGILGMGILREYWGLGIGTQLLEALFSWAVKNGISKIDLKVHENNHRARALYEKNGFSEEGRIRNASRLREGFVDLIYMGKVL